MTAFVHELHAAALDPFRAALRWLLAPADVKALHLVPEDIQ